MRTYRAIDQLFRLIPPGPVKILLLPLRDENGGHGHRANQDVVDHEGSSVLLAVPHASDANSGRRQIGVPQRQLQSPASEPQIPEPRASSDARFYFKKISFV